MVRDLGWAQLVGFSQGLIWVRWLVWDEPQSHVCRLIGCLLGLGAFFSWYSHGLNAAGIGIPQHASAFQVSTCIKFVNIAMVKTSYIVKPRVKE